MSRHMACQLCRDRKVRCDGEIECENCRRSGEPCIYIPTQKPTKSDLMQTIEVLQERLEKAEAFVASQSLAAQCNPYISRNNEPISLEKHGFEFQVPPFSELSNDLLHGQESMQTYQHLADGPQTPENSDTILYHLSSSRPSPTMTTQNDVFRSNMESLEGVRAEPFGPNHTSGQSRPGTTSGISHMPSLWEVRAINTASSQIATTKVSPGPECDCEQDYSVLCASLSKFLTAVTKTQSEIAGISSSVAEYLSWMRREPITGTPKALKANYVMVLETLEARAREVHDLAERNHFAAWEELMAEMTEAEDLDDKLRPIEEKMRERAAEIATLFKHDYDICVSLSEQNHRNQVP